MMRYTKKMSWLYSLERHSLRAVSLMGLAAGTALTLLLAPQPVRAAEISVETLEDGTALIRMSGEITSGDEKSFQDIALKFDDAVVFLDSQGGALQPGLEIGRSIALRGYNTFVPDNSLCASSCALIWLAGESRFLAPTASLGFHASYRNESGQAVESGVGNALIGHYLSRLNLPTKAVIFVTQAPPSSMLWLDPSNMHRSGIPFELVDFTESPVATVADSPVETSAIPKLVQEFQTQMAIAKTGDPRAQNRVGGFFYNGDGVLLDYVKAAYWFDQAAKQGLGAAQANLATMYSAGVGVIQDHSEAMRLYKLAAEQGLEYAQFMLGEMYHRGHGTKRDWVKSYMWFNIAASHGSEEAQKRRDSLRLSHKDLTAAQRLSRECIDQNYMGC